VAAYFVFSVFLLIVKASHSRKGGALLMVKRSVEKFNMKVAALLPGSSKGLETRDLLATSSAFSALTNRTVHYLETNGQCLDDVHVKTSVTSSSEMGIYAQRPIKKGNVIVPVPIYVRRRDGSCVTDHDSCTASTIGQDFAKHCFGHKDSSLLLCPLSSAAYIETSSRDSESATKPNAALKWSSGINVKSIHKVALDEVLKVRKQTRNSKIASVVDSHILKCLFRSILLA